MKKRSDSVAVVVAELPNPADITVEVRVPHPNQSQRNVSVRRRGDVAQPERREPSECTEPPQIAPAPKLYPDTDLGRAMARAATAVAGGEPHGGLVYADVLGLYGLKYEAKYGQIPHALEAPQVWKRALRQAEEISADLKVANLVFGLVNFTFRRHAKSTKAQGGERVGWGLVYYQWQKGFYHEELAKSGRLPEPDDGEAEPQVASDDEPSPDSKRWAIFAALHAIQESSLSSTLKLVAMAIALSADKGGVTIAAQTTIARRTTLVIRTVRRAFTELTNLGVSGESPLRLNRTRRSKSGGLRTSDEIQLEFTATSSGDPAARRGKTENDSN